MSMYLVNSDFTGRNPTVQLKRGGKTFCCWSKSPGPCASVLDQEMMEAGFRYYILE